MIIRKRIDFENAHVVRNCSTKRCKYSVHGHSYQIELFFTAGGLDNGGMVMDFSITKDLLKPILDSWDHCHSFWDKDDAEYIASCKKFSQRWISTPLSPSAESMSLMFMKICDAVINNTKFSNGEKSPKVTSVRVHETLSGYAEATMDDVNNPNFPQFDLKDIIFSDGVKEDWPSVTLYDDVLNGNVNVLPIVEQQVKQ